MTEELSRVRGSSYPKCTVNIKNGCPDRRQKPSEIEREIYV